MAVVYLVFNEGYAATARRRAGAPRSVPRGDPARPLARGADAGSPEALGLLALMLLHDARRDARTDEHGDLVLLEDQDRARWDRAQIDEALSLVPFALRGRRAGAYALQAAIAALHATQPPTDWAQIAALYAALHARVAVGR